MSADPLWPWSVLGLERMPPAAADVRRAYARALKKIDQSKDIEGFATLRAAYEAALSQREGADGRNAARRASRAAARPAEPQEQEAAPPPPLQPDAATLAAVAEEAEFAALLHTGFDAVKDAPDDARMLAILDSRFMDDPARKQRIERAFAPVIAGSFVRTDDEDWGLSDAFSPRLVQRLDESFGWLSDYAAFTRAFGRNDTLLHVLLLRANDDRPFDTGAAPVRRSWWRRAVDALFSWPALFALYVLARAADSLRTAEVEDLNQTLLAVLVVILCLAAAVGALRFVMFLHGLYLRVFHSHTAAVATALTLAIPVACLPVYGAAQQAMYGVGLALALSLLLGLSVLRGKIGLRVETWLRSIVRRP